MQNIAEDLDDISDKDEIIKRQCLELACLAAQVDNQYAIVADMVQERVSEYALESEDIVEQKRKLERIVENTLKSLRFLCKDENERLKYLMAMDVVDEDWYRSKYPDVSENYAKGPLHHYCKFGMFEGRKPNGWMA